MRDPKPGSELDIDAMLRDDVVSDSCALRRLDVPMNGHAAVLAALPRETTRGFALSSAVRWAIAHVARHYARRLPLRELAAVTGKTSFQLIRAFRREVGLTPHVFLLRVRVHCGTAMLLRGEPLAGIAHAVGFVDQAHFTRHFKRVHGRTPTQFLVALRVRGADAAGGRCEAGAS